MLIDTEYRMHFKYDDYIRDSQMEIRVEPQTLPHQALHSFQLSVGPQASVERYIDWNGNWVHHLSIRDYHDRIEILAHSLVDTWPDGRSLAQLDTVMPEPDSPQHLDFIRFDGPVERTGDLEELEAKISSDASAPVGEQVVAVGNLLGTELEYRAGITTWRSSVAEVLVHRSGVCQDFTHVALGLLRLRGIPCRYVSGYLHLEGDTTQSHAWIEVFGANCGWVAYDPTHQRETNEHYVTVGTGRNYGDVPPNRGVYRGSAREALRADVHMETAASVDVAQLQRQNEGIDVPTYTELPASARSNETRSGEMPDPQREQQQQQQQTSPLA